MAQRRLADHLSCELLPLLIRDSNNESNGCADSDKWHQVEKVHVSQVLPGGTCVPDPSKVRWNTSVGGSPTNRW